MSPERINLAKQLLLAALECKPAERQAFIERACAGDESLRKELLSLLGQDSTLTDVPGPFPSRPETIGRYVVEGHLGAGGMGIVYLARDPALGRQVAIKSIRFQGESPEQQLWLKDRLLREARAAAVLSHPGIVAIHDIFEHENLAYIVMEYAGSTNLSKVLTNELPSREWLLRVVRQTAEALDYAHGKGVIHRDIKPANIILNDAQSVKVADFGIAKLTSTSNTTSTQMVLGTVEYMSPEQIKAERVDGRADQFSLAVMAYRMLTGRTPYPEADSLPSLSYKICNQDAPSPSLVEPLLPPAIDAIFHRALAKLPADRFPLCTEFAASLEAAFSAASAPPRLPPPVPGPGGRKPNPVPIVRGLAAVIAVLGGIGWWIIHRETPEPPPPAKPPIAQQQPAKTEPTHTDTVQVKPPAAIDEPPPPPEKPRMKPTAPPPAEPKAEPKPDPVAAYSGPTLGQMVWTGVLEPGAELNLSPENSSLKGSPLPGVEVSLQITPQVVELSGPPAKASGWKNFTVRNTTSRKQTLLIIKWQVVSGK